MMNNDKSRQQWAKETYDELITNEHKNISHNKTISRKVEKANENIESCHFNIKNDYRDGRIVFVIICSMLIFCNIMIWCFFWNKTNLILKFVIILFTILIAIGIVYGLYACYFKKNSFDFYIINSKKKLVISKIKNYIYFRSCECFYKICNNCVVEISKEEYFTDNHLFNYVFEFDFTKKLNCYRQKIINNKTIIRGGGQFGNLYYSGDSISELKIELNQKSGKNYPSKILFSLHYINKYWRKFWHYNEEDIYFGYSFKGIYDDINNENMEIKLPSWFFEQCDKNGIVLPKMNFIIEENKKRG